jgi:hypothetical protein
MTVNDIKHTSTCTDHSQKEMCPLCAGDCVVFLHMCPKEVELDSIEEILNKKGDITKREVGTLVGKLAIAKKMKLRDFLWKLVEQYNNPSAVEEILDKHEPFCRNPFEDHLKCVTNRSLTPFSSDPILVEKEPEVVQILYKCIEIYRAKASDYNHPSKHTIDPLSNFRVAEELGIQAYVGAMVRMADKWERIKTLTYKSTRGEGPAVKDESIEDTLMDIINYGAIVLALHRQANASK